MVCGELGYATNLAGNIGLEDAKVDTSPVVSGPVDPAIASLDRLLAIAATDTGQARSVANVLLAGDNARAYGGFDSTELRAVSDPVRADMLQVIGLIARERHHAAAYGHQDAFAALVRRWRSGVPAATR